MTTIIGTAKSNPSPWLEGMEGSDAHELIESE